MGETLGCEGEEIIDIAFRVVLSTIAVIRTTAGRTEVVRAGERGQAASEEVHNSPNDPLGCQGGSSITEAKGPVEKNLAAPADREED